MSSAALSSARSDAAVGGSRFRDHINNHPDYEVLAYIDGHFQTAGADRIPGLDKAVGVAFGRYTNCSAEQVDRAVAAARRAQPGYGGVGQQRAITRRQWIGVQTTDVRYPAWAESQSPDQRTIKGRA